jgi:hypothetical protein
MPTETWYALFSAIITGLVLKVGDWVIGRSKDGREVQKDYREEIKELWEHSESQDAKITALQNRLIEKDKTIADLQLAIEREDMLLEATVYG